jgi:hypothetical protein
MIAVYVKCLKKIITTFVVMIPRAAPLPIGPSFRCIPMDAERLIDIDMDFRKSWFQKFPLPADRVSLHAVRSMV